MTDNQLFYLLPIIAFLAGAIIGSFVTLASWRLPRGQDIVFKPSYCPQCGATLTLRELIPLLSWSMQRGRCLHCSASIGARYPLTELLLGIAFAALTFVYGFSLETLLLLLLISELAILILTDLEHTLIPDGVQVALFFTGIAWNILHDAETDAVLMSALTGLGIGLLLHFGYKWLRKKDGLGWADVKFFCVAGVWLPLTSFVSFVFFAGLLGTLTGLLWRKRGRGAIFPFGPALAVSLLINVLWPDLLHRFL